MSNVLVYGGAGALGAAVVSFFKKSGWVVTSVDIRGNEDAHHNVLIGIEDGVALQAKTVLEGMSSVLKGGKVDALLCVAGGWAGGNAKSNDFLANAELMWKQSVNSSLVASHIAAHHLKENGLLTLTGALAATGPTPGMIGYGIAKAAVHHLVQDLAAPGSGLPENAIVNAICPVTLDTPMNRKWMAAGADLSKWTPLDVVAKRLYEWATRAVVATRGKLVEVATSEGMTTFREL